MNYSEKFISQLVNGDAVLSYDTACRLEYVLGLPASFWNTLEAQYRETLERVRQENEMDEDISISRLFPYSEMVSLGVVNKSKDKYEKVSEIRRFFSVANLTLIPATMPVVACRRLSLSEKSDYALMVFVQKAKIEAEKVETEVLSLKQLKRVIPDIRCMTRSNFDDVSKSLSDLLASCGIAIVFMPTLSGSFLHGATFMDRKKIVIGITARGRDADIFWFSLFHEIGHIIYGHYAKSEVTKEDEKLADGFAANILIEDGRFQDFCKKEDFSKGSVTRFACDLGIDPGIVVGRLQRMKLISYRDLSFLKKKLMF